MKNRITTNSSRTCVRINFRWYDIISVDEVEQVFTRADATRLVVQSPKGKMRRVFLNGHGWDFRAKSTR